VPEWQLLWRRRPRKLRAKLAELGPCDDVLIWSREGFDENLFLAARNLPHVDVP
jgi:ribosomal protein L4